MDRQTLIDTIHAKQSFLCVGLDPDPARMPAHLGTGPEAVLAFNRALIEATSDLAVAYKPNVAFYESMGAAGWAVLEETGRDSLPACGPMILLRSREVAQLAAPSCS